MLKYVLGSLVLVVTISGNLDAADVLPPNNASVNMLYLGASDGKTYFTDQTFTGDWGEAQRYCRESNMRIASILTPGQQSLLKGAYDSLRFFGDHWLSGRDILNIEQFIWDGDWTKPELNVVPFDTNGPGPHLTYCLDYLPEWGVLQADRCTEKKKVICMA